MPETKIKALLFDVFGTVVDWRSGIARDLAAWGERSCVQADWPKMADAWRDLYQPAMEQVRSGNRGFVRLDQLHKENLLKVCEQFGFDTLSPENTRFLVTAWHRLDPWPDSVAGLARLKERFIIAPCSNGNIALITNMAKRARLPWDVVLGAEVARAYKPDRQAYLGSAEALGLRPQECMMVAAHQSDLEAAAKLGMATAYVLRPDEFGPDVPIEPTRDGAWTYVADSFEDLAGQLGC